MRGLEEPPPNFKMILRMTSEEESEKNPFRGEGKGANKGGKFTHGQLTLKRSEARDQSKVSRLQGELENKFPRDASTWLWVIQLTHLGGEALMCVHIVTFLKPI